MGTMVMSVSPGTAKLPIVTACPVEAGTAMLQHRTRCLSENCDLHALRLSVAQRPGTGQAVLVQADGPYGNVQAAYATSECIPDQ